MNEIYIKWSRRVGLDNTIYGNDKTDTAKSISDILKYARAIFVVSACHTFASFFL